MPSAMRRLRHSLAALAAAGLLCLLIVLGSEERAPVGRQIESPQPIAPIHPCVLLPSDLQTADEVRSGGRSSRPDWDPIGGLFAADSAR